MGGQKVRDTSVMETFGDRVRVLRKEKKITQEELSNMAGVSTSQVARIETGKLNTTICTLIRIAKAMSIDPCDLLHDFKSIQQPQR